MRGVSRRTGRISFPAGRDEAQSGSLCCVCVDVVGKVLTLAEVTSSWNCLDHW